MANPEHVAWIKSGVEIWNAWCMDLSEEIDLRGADLNGLDLRGAYLMFADLSGANLSDTSLCKADFRGANLSDADLRGANLRGAIIEESIQLNVKWRLVWKLVNEGASDVELCGVDLSFANLSNTDLRDTDLSRTNLSRTNLSRTNLSRTNLSRANLSAANLRAANLNGANFNYADLSNANIRMIQALGTNFSAATLTGGCIEDWNINFRTNLQNVICEFIFFKYDFKQKKFVDRRPHTPNTVFQPGEFAVLVQKSLETIDLIFLDGIDWKALLDSLEDLKSQYGDELSVQGVEKKTGGAFLVRLEVPPEGDKGEIERAVKEGYETKLQLMEAKYRAELKELKMQHSTEIIALYKQHNADMTEITKRLADKPITVEAKAVAENNQAPKYDLRGSNIGNLVDTAESGSRVQAIQHNYASEVPSLAEAAAEIQKLLQQLEQSNPDATGEEQKAFVNAMTPPPLRQRAVSALVAGGEAALVELPYGKVAKAIIEGWREPDSGRG